MRINKLTLDYFLVHIHYTAHFTAGLNVIRGANEKGKSSSMEGLGYCLFGTEALVGTKSETVNDTAPSENSLNTLAEFEHENSTYECQRSFKGAELKRNGEIVCTGQGVVTTFIEELLGLPARVASHQIILADQNKIRGALALGPTAASEFIEKLANFEEIDNLIKFLQAKLPNGPTGILEEAATISQLRVEELAAAPAVDPAIHDVEITELTRKAGEAQAHLILWQTQKQGIEEVKRAAEQRIATLTPQIAGIDAQIRSKTAAQANLTELVAKVDMAKTEMGTIEAELIKAADYEIYKSLPAAPEDVWDADFASLEAEIAKQIKIQAALQAEVTGAAAQITLLLKQKLQTGNCPTCGKAYTDPAEACAVNEAAETQITALQTKSKAAGQQLADSRKYQQALGNINYQQALVDGWVEKFPARAQVDYSAVPWALTWAGPVPEKIEKQPLEARYTKLNTVVTEAASAPSKLEVLKSEIESLRGQATEKNTEFIEADKARRVDDKIGALQLRITPLHQELTGMNMRLQELRQQQAVLTAQKKAAEAAFAEASKALQSSQQRLREQRENNVLIKTVKDARILVSAQLWQKVLGAASYYFSALRGKVSHVVRDKGAFRVEGERGRLSGSTLDVLGLALRIVISKMFSRARLMGLDEPSAGCDQIRTAAMVGTLLGAEFEQIILVTHDDLIESGATNVIEL